MRVFQCNCVTLRQRIWFIYIIFLFFTFEKEEWIINRKKEDNYILASSSFKFIHFIIVCVLCEKKSSSAVCSFFSRVVLLLLLLRKMVRFLCPIHHLFSELTLQHYTKKNLFCRVPFFVCECLSKKMKKKKRWNIEDCCWKTGSNK